MRTQNDLHSYQFFRLIDVKDYRIPKCIKIALQLIKYMVSETPMFLKRDELNQTESGARIQVPTAAHRPDEGASKPR
jgi:hypothetical protein